MFPRKAVKPPAVEVFKAWLDKAMVLPIFVCFYTKIGSLYKKYRAKGQDKTLLEGILKM